MQRQYTRTAHRNRSHTHKSPPTGDGPPTPPSAAVPYRHHARAARRGGGGAGGCSCQLYTKFGFEPVGELKDFVKKGFTELLMRKTVGAIVDYKASS